MGTGGQNGTPFRLLRHRVWGLFALSKAANDDTAPVRGPSKPRGKRKGLRAAANRALAKLRNLLGQGIPENAAEAREAVRHFLNEMTLVAARTYPAWNRLLNDGLAECALGYDERRGLLEVHPIDDYYFAAVVALEAVKLRSLYTPAEAAELLSEIGEQVDVAAGRQDRVVSDLVFALVGRITLGAGVDKMKTPYDMVVKSLLQHLGFNKVEATKNLLRDVGFRHMLGEPLALGVPQWWKAFHAKFSIYWNEPEEVYLDEDDVIPTTATAPAVSPRRRQRRRAAAF